MLVANVAVMTACAAALAFGLLPKVERAVQAAERAEARFQRAEERFSGFADEVQPVLVAGAGKAIDTIEKMDVRELSETATERAGTLIDAAADRARRFLDKDKDDGSNP